MPAIETAEAPACQRMVFPGTKQPTRWRAWVAVIQVLFNVSNLKLTVSNFQRPTIKTKKKNTHFRNPSRDFPRHFSRLMNQHLSRRCKIPHKPLPSVSLPHPHHHPQKSVPPYTSPKTSSPTSNPLPSPPPSPNSTTHPENSTPRIDPACGGTAYFPSRCRRSMRFRPRL